MARSLGLRKRRTHAQWNAVLRRFATSGLSSREFCGREGVALSSLQRWRGRLGEASSAAGFVELTAPPAAVSEQTSWVVELTLPNGVILRLQG